MIAMTAKLKGELKDSFDRNAILIMASYGVSAILGFLFWIVVARTYPPSAVGIGTAAVSAMLLIGSLASMGFDFALVRFLPQAENPRAMINTCLSITGLVAMGLATMFIFKLPQLEPVRSQPLLMLAFVGFSSSIAASELQPQIFIAYRQAKFRVLQVLVNGSRVAVMIALLHRGVTGILSAIGISSLIALVTGFIITRRLQNNYRPIPVVDAALAKSISKFSLSNYLASIFVMLPAYVMPLIIFDALSPESCAHFFVPFNLSFAIGMIAISIAYSFLAECSHEVCDIRKQTLKATRLILAITIPALVIVLGLGDKILGLFGATYTQNSTLLLWIFAAGWMLYIITALYLTIARLKLRTKMMTITNALLAGLVVGLGTGLMGPFGLTGVAVGFLVAQGIVASIALPKLLREIQISPRIAFSPRFFRSMWTGEAV